MKREMITLSVSGVLAVFTAGVLFAGALYSGVWPMFLVALALLNYVREDARERWQEGEWRRGRIIWTHKDHKA